MIVLYATLPIDPSRRNEALDITEELVEASNQEDGTIDYRATVDIQDENTIRFFEQYEDEEALGAHNQSEHFQKLEEELPDLLAGEPEVVQFEVSEATELEL